MASYGQVKQWGWDQKRCRSGLTGGGAEGVFAQPKSGGEEEKGELGGGNLTGGIPLSGKNKPPADRKRRYIDHSE